jgi:F-type H+-transporting ATPase subunit epsilon
MKTLRLELVTPNARVWRGDVRSVTIPAAKGDMGVLPGHAPYLGLLNEGRVTARPATRGQRLLTFNVTGGFAEVLPDSVTILADSAELPSSIPNP